MNSVAKFRSFPATKIFPGGLLDDFFNHSIADFIGSDNLINQPAVNISETNTSYELEVAAPGFEKQDFTLHVENDYLTIGAQRENKQEETGERFTRREFRYDGFKRSFKLPLTVNQDKVSAVYNNGILQVTLPKKEEATSVVKTIVIS